MVTKMSLPITLETFSTIHALASRAYYECAEIIATFRASRTTEDGHGSVPASASEEKNDSGSPSRPLKRSRNEESDAPSSAQLSSSPPEPECAGSSDTPSPSKRRKSKAVVETPGSSSGTTRTKKRVRFHPETLDNSLWADLDWYKRKEEIRRQVASSSNLAQTETIQTVPCSSSSALPTAVSSRNGLTPPKNPRTTPTRRQISRERAKQFLKNKSWLNGNGFVYLEQRSDEESESDDDALIVHLADGGFRRVRDVDDRNDVDDVSVPRSSPPPSTRRRAMDASAAEAKRFQDEMTAMGRKKTGAGLSSISPGPHLSHLGTSLGSPTSGPIAEDSNPGPPKTRLALEEVSDHIAFLESALNGLPADDSRRAFAALEGITRFYSHSTFAEGVRQGAKAVETVKSRQKADTTST